MSKLPFVITVDGPSGVGKGTLSALLADHLDWHLLDSGALYRIVAYMAQQKSWPIDETFDWQEKIQALAISFKYSKEKKGIDVYCEQQCISQETRQEAIGELASQLAQFSGVRSALLQKQQDFLLLPGLVADGRDMGSVVFPKAPLKFYLTASVLVRANRRYEQLKEKGLDVNLDKISLAIDERDKRDSQRQIAPLRPADDAIIIDTSELTVTQVFDKVLTYLPSLV